MAGRGTLLNFAAVLFGSLLGLALQKQLKPEWLESVRLSLGIVTICFGLKMFLSSRNPVIVALAVALGGLIGVAVGLDREINALAGDLRAQLQGDRNFVEGLVLTFVLFCVGPMTLLGCIQDAMERKIDLLKMKSAMDGVVSVFFAAAFGSGVLVTAFLLLAFQGLLTILASPLQSLAKDQEITDEITGVGGPVLVIVGVSLAGIVQVSSANYLPALFLAPLLVLVFRHVPQLRARKSAV